MRGDQGGKKKKKKKQPCAPCACALPSLCGLIMKHVRLFQADVETYEISGEPKERYG